MTGRVASNTAVQLAGKGAVLALGAVSIAVLTRYLGPNDYGRYTLALMYMQLFGVLVDVGVYTTVVRDISKDPSRTRELVGNALTLRLLLSLAVIALGAGISLLLPYDASVRVAIVLAGGPLLFGMLATTFVAILQSRLRMGRAAVADVVGRAATLALTVVVAALDLGFYAVMVAAGGGALATLVATWLVTRPVARVRFRLEPAVWRGMLAAALPLGLALAINAIYFRADTLIISLFEPYDQVGLYTLAYRILELAITVGAVFLITVFPVLSAAVTHDEERARRTIEASTDVLVVLGVPLVAAGLLLAPQVIELAGGAGFEDAATPLRILLAAGALSWVNGVFGYALIAKERYGIVSAAAVTVASEILILAGSYHLMQRHFGFFPAPRTLAPALAAAGGMAAVLWLLRDAPFAALAPLSVGVYAGLLWAISPATREAVAGARR
jgi:O-antigen/teichoic acid export membrane protein